MDKKLLGAALLTRKAFKSSLIWPQCMIFSVSGMKKIKNWHNINSEQLKASLTKVSLPKSVKSIIVKYDIAYQWWQVFPTPSWRLFH
jgi:hypothetical protein